MSETTFRGYTSEQAKYYAEARVLSYPRQLYETILNHHAKRGGTFKRYLDIGCSPGRATRDLARHFDQAIGVDHSAEMIETAKTAGYQARACPVEFLVSDAENFDKLGQIPAGSIDLISGGMAAHWFDMDKFWTAAAHVLAPGGTVALWTCSSLYCHPETPEAAKVQEILFDLENNVLGPYALPGNLTSRGMYKNLELPWDISPVEGSFNKDKFIRMEWNGDGRLEPGDSDFLVGYTVTIKEMREKKSSASMYTRWAEAHPEVAGTEQDIIKVQARKVQDVTGLQDSDQIKFGSSLVLLLLSTRG